MSRAVTVRLAQWWLVITLLPVSTALDATIRVTDDLGYELVLTEPARRIISLAPDATESLFAVGAGELIIATVDYSDYPVAAQSIPSLGALHRVNIERVVSYQPDLVVASYSANRPEVVERLRKLGLKVYASEPAQLEDIARNLRNFALLTERGPEGLAAADRFVARLANLSATYAHRPPVTVMYQVWHEPLMSANDQSLIGAVIRLCGGINVFGAAVTQIPVVNVEAVLEANPQVIVAGGMANERADWLERWRMWRNLDAARNNHLYFINPDLMQRYSVRMLEGAEHLCGLLQRVREAESSPEG